MINEQVQAITANELYQLIEQPKIIFVDFWAKWCAPCRQFAPVYAKVAAQYQDVLFTSIDIEQEAALAEELQIRSIPHLMVFKNGIAIYSESGSVPESVLHELVAQAKAANVDELRDQKEE